MDNISRASSPPSLSQVVALSMTYRRILSVLGLPPAVVFALPFVSKISYFFLDRLTNNHTILSLFMTAFFTATIRNMIQKAASKFNQSAQEALGKIEVGLPCIMFVASTLMINIVVTPLEERMGVKEILTWSPTITFYFAIRIALGMVLLGLSVVFRFVGAPSVVRCSTSPLLAHPFVTALRAALSNFSADALLDFLARPNETPNEFTKNQLEYKGSARRLQHPTFTACISQIVISAVASLLVAFTSVLPFSAHASHGNSSYKAALIVSCIAATVIHLMQTALNGSAHELNPHRYHARQSWNWPRLLARTRPMFQTLIASSVVVPAIAIVASSFVSEAQEDDNETLWTMVSACLLTASALTLYLYIFDDALRTILCTPPLNMKRVVESVADDDRMETYLDVAMYSLLHSDPSLVKDLSSSSTPAYINLEREERQRNEVSVKAMANLLLHKTATDETAAHLEEDILRLAILASLGGTSWNGESSSGLDKAEPYHVENIKHWIEPSDKMKLGGKRSEPFAVPLLRALCAYFGGLGEALLICAGQKTSMLANPWSLPPGAIVCAEYALRAAARCIVWNLSHSARLHSAWRSTHLTMLIPVFLNSACRLELGMVKFTQARYGGKPSDHLENLELIRTESPEFLPIYHACNDSAAMILKKIRSLEGVGRIDFDLDTDCQKWMNNILARIPNPQAQPANGKTIIPVFKS